MFWCWCLCRVGRGAVVLEKERERERERESACVCGLWRFYDFASDQLRTSQFFLVHIIQIVANWVLPSIKICMQ